MLYTETVAPKTLELLKRIMQDTVFNHFLLVGGTALSLQLGHRISVDLDLFCKESFDENKLADYLRTEYNFELDYIDKETLKGEVDGVKLDCIAHKYPWLTAPVVENEIRLASYNDIAAMKLNAITGNGTRLKDFIDISFLSAYLTLNEMLNAYQLKYNSNAVMVLKALTYFDEINFNEPINMLNNDSFDWKKIKKQLLLLIKYPDKLF
ncbi:MAG: nucleotidyl transferase AbiEii/AbiGii toxin family protein [Paludibacter sp.]|nr:nucleotidyl transferase AbiEii/AbiGii toxin family protein [Paludibacter sp.]